MSIIFTEKRVEIIKDLIKLAEKRNQIFTKASEKVLVEQELLEYLSSLDFDEIKFIQTVMYIGRDEDHEGDLIPEIIYEKKFQELGWSTKEIEVSQIFEKMPLDDYLKDGMKILDLQ